MRRLLLPVLVLLSVAGCFERVGVNDLTCTKDKACPDGYVCALRSGKCQKPTDAGRADVFVGDGPSGSDARADAATDGPTPPGDGPTADSLARADQSPSPDGPMEPDAPSLGPDTPSDAPASSPDTPNGPNLGPDLATDRGKADAVANVGPDLGPDLAPDLGRTFGPDLGPDLPPTAGCGIGENYFAAGTPNPANACQICKPAASSSTWSNLDEGSPCTGGVCSAGICQTGCWIGGTLVGAGITNSANACQVCKPATTTSAWTSVVDGTNCGSGPTCSGTTKSYGHWACQGGSCVQPAATTCPSTGCDTSTGLCKDACGTASTAGPVPCGTICCASNQFCLGNTNCAPKAGPGSACPNGNSQCTTNYCVEGTCCGSSSCGSGETCASGTCACAMSAAKVCNACADWDFEWGTTASPWLLDLAPAATGLGLTNGATSVAITSSLYHVGVGSHALMAQLNLDPGALNNTGEVAVSLSCATSLAGYQVSMWLYIAGPALSQWNDGLVLDTWNGGVSGELLPVFNGGVPTGQWVQASVTIPAADTTAVNRVGIRLVPSVVWSGQIYIDDVVFTAP